MSSETSTERAGARSVGAPKSGAPYAEEAPDSGFQPWHFFLLLAMAGATIAVARTDQTHPAALLLLSAAVVAAGLAGFAAYRALGAFFGFSGSDAAPLTTSARDGLLREKALTLRSIKELEFDHAMGKISHADFHDMGGRLRARALDLMEALERTPAMPAARSRPSRTSEAPLPVRTCAGCGTAYDDDARFCKQCGRAVA
jgi:hypothetical protein